MFAVLSLNCVVFPINVLQNKEMTLTISLDAEVSKRRFCYYQRSYKTIISIFKQYNLTLGCLQQQYSDFFYYTAARQAYRTKFLDDLLVRSCYSIFYEWI